MRAKRAEGGIAKTPVITICSEPGSGGHLVAHGTAKKLGFDVFQKDLIKRIAENVETSTAVIESLEKKRFSGIEDFISSLINKHYVWPGLYLEHLMKVVNVIAKHGHAVIIGRGANFILPPSECFTVRTVAPLESRVKNVATMHKVLYEEAKRRVLTRQSKRHAFVRQSFHADIDYNYKYYIVIYTERLSIDQAIEIIIHSYSAKFPKALESTEHFA